MKTEDFEQIYDQLFGYCEQENFAGADPFDGLNSKIFQATPLKYFTLSRLAWLQMVKRSGRDLRPLLKIEKGVNPKGIALFSSAELARFRVTDDNRHAENAKELLDKLLTLKIRQPKSRHQKAKTAFGYNFDWQSRAFYAPQGTPTIVPTAFAAFAFLEADKLFEDKKYLKIVVEIGRFIEYDLNRPFENETELCFSYTPVDDSIIFNASLLAGEVLANIGKITGNKRYLELAEKTANFVINRQNENGSWTYGSKLRHAWVDNFHTAYILLSLYRLQKFIPSLQDQAEQSIRRGLDFWLKNFFLADGTPKYFDKQTYPVDIHSAAAAIVALCDLNEFDERCLPQAETVAVWTVKNMRDEQGFFYYQRTRSRTSKTSFIRWANAWMALALAKLLECRIKH